MAVSRPRRACPLFSIRTNSTPLSTPSPTETSAINVPATYSGWLLPYEYKSLKALLDTHLTLLAFKYSHTLWPMTLQLAPESINIVTGKPPIFTGILPSLETFESPLCQMHIHNHHPADLRLLFVLYDGVYHSFLYCLLYTFLQLLGLGTILLPLCFIYSLKMSCPITFPALFPSS